MLYVGVWRVWGGGVDEKGGGCGVYAQVFM